MSWTPNTPLRYETATYEDVPENIRALFEAARETGKGLYIHGEVGTGKTHILYALRKNPLAYGSLVWNVTELLQALKDDFDRRPEEKRWHEHALMNCEMIFLDDLGTEKISDWTAESLYRIINRCYNQRLPLIVTSNLRIGEISARIGDRIASRLVEMCHVIELKGEDRRLKK